MQQEGEPQDKKRPILRRVLSIALVVVLGLAVAFSWYVSDFYHADEQALAAAADEDGSADGVAVVRLQTGELAFVPANPKAGMVFYPGAKVQPESYAVLLTECARHDVLCVLVVPPFNLAFFDVDAAARVMPEFPDVDTWILAGHSLGGVAATSYLSGHQEDIDGLVLLASYPQADLSNYGGVVVSVVGENDGVLNRSAYDQAQAKLPSTAREVAIPGGNHANYANYGGQAGDGQADITHEAQQAQTVEALLETVELADQTPQG